MPGLSINGPERSETPRQYPVRGWRRHRNLLGVLFGVPRAVLQGSFTAIFGTLNFTASLIGSIGANVLPAPLVRNIQGTTFHLVSMRVPDLTYMQSTVYTQKIPQKMLLSEKHYIVSRPSFKSCMPSDSTGGLRSLGESRRLDPQSAASAFVHRFSTQYGSEGPNWQETSWAEATRRAHAQFKFLLVYLHSPSHQVSL